MRFLGGILAGGRSSRMGRAKHSLRLHDGRTMIEHVAATLNDVCDEILISAAEPTGVNARHVADLRPDAGPLAGVEALLQTCEVSSGDRNVNAVRLLIVPCDQPGVPPALLRRLLDAGDSALTVFRIPTMPDQHERLAEPFPMLISASMTVHLRSFLDQGGRSATAFVGRHAERIVDLAADEAPLLGSLNTPDEFREWMRESGS